MKSDDKQYLCGSEHWTFCPSFHDETLFLILFSTYRPSKLRAHSNSTFWNTHSQVTGKCGSVRVRLIPAPKGTGLVAAPATKKMLAMAGIKDCYTSSRGHTRTMGNFVKAVFFALKKTYSFLTPDLWKPTEFSKTLFQEHTNFLKSEAEKIKVAEQ